MSLNGQDILIMADIDGLGNYLAVASQTNAQVAESNAVIDQSAKDTGRSRKVAPGRYEANVSFDALYVPNDAAFAALRQACRLGTKIGLRQLSQGVAVEQYLGIITSMTREFPDQENATIAMEVAVDGDITII
jgi:TP901-1 family phage major tail protein